MKVRAKEYGQYKGRMYETGQEFDIADKDLAWWMQDVTPPQQPPLSPVKKGLVS